MRPISLDHIARARTMIDPVFLDSPLLRGTVLDAMLGLRVALKVECLNPIRSFKGRGAEYFTALLDGCQHLICASAGNFGQGLAYAGTRRGHRVTVYAAKTASLVKLAAMRRLGAEVVLAGNDFDAAKTEARRFANASGARFVEDGAQPEIAEGAGTMALELIEVGWKPEVVLVPLGNGALAGGVATALKARWPDTTICCVTADGAPAMKQSIEAGAYRSTEDVRTIADGIAVRDPVPYALETLKGIIDDVISVSDARILKAMRLLHQHLGLVIEPAGAVGLAALLDAPRGWQDASVATILCGGNVDPERYQAWLLG